MRDINGRFISGTTSDRRKEWNGKRFGKLLVVDTKYGVNLGNRKRTICICKCDCGKQVEVVSDSLSGNKKTSCGCDTAQKRRDANRVDLTGRRFGRLVVMDMLWGRPTKCRCMCDCGNETVVMNTGLTSGKTMSCGCYQRDRASEVNTKSFSGIIADNGVEFIRQSKKSDQGVWLWECRCPYCGSIFEALPARILNGHTTSCGCLVSSVAESYIDKLLSSEGTTYKRQYRFNDCKDKYSLPFDFAILNKDGDVVHLIEYDGAQHYKPSEFFGGNFAFQKRVEHDRIKDDYCVRNNIALTRLPYTMSLAEITNTIKNIVNP